MAQDVDVNEKSSILGKRDLKDMKNDDSSESSDLEILTVPKKKRHRIESIQSEKDSTTTSTNQNINTKTVTGSEDRISTAKAKKKLIKLLRDIKQPIEVSVGGIAKNVPSVPLLYISEIGLIPLPLNEYTINQLLQKMKTSSFGRHLWTETDESIRKSYELTADQFECKNPNFDISIQKLAKSTGKLMGVDDEYVVAVPYKLILYEPGSHFVEHRDTEKLEGMFGTLVIQLPSIYTVENGLPVLSVKHLDTEFEYHFGAEEKCDFPPSAANIFYAANHADLRHTVNKIESGHRLILTYNLIISDGKQQPKIPYGEELNGKLRSVLTKWDGSAPLMMLLEHLYTEKSMNDRGMDALKGLLFDVNFFQLPKKAIFVTLHII